ncbi:MAG: endolytic transglycosylase MltG [Acidobacteria bacterium]|nr:endolytic transglycosylase MltG [Acidobacteriota bacterium]
MRRAILYTSAAVLLAMAAGIGSVAAWLHAQLDAPYYNAPTRETFVEIVRGSNTGQIAHLLVESGILRSRIPFLAYLRFTGGARDIKAGEYRFDGPASPKEIIGRLIRGDVYYRVLTVPEGLTAAETIELIARNGFGTFEGMEPLLRNTDWIRDMDPGAENLEGYLFPETYHFGRKPDPGSIIKTMVEQFRKKFQEIRAELPMPAGWDISRAVILASMIEKEARKADERPLVSSVFHNRLDRRMPLACDATIIYAMKLRGTYNGNIRKSDLSMESPYNSYIHRGLPPGPIANPGADSLRAALNPAETEYLYYVSRNDGTHVFSKTYREHRQAVNKYQRFR